MNKRFDAIVLGAGMAGLGVAKALADMGRSVLIADVKSHKGKSSPAAGGILDPLLEMKSGSPFLPFCLKAFREWSGDLAKIEKLAGKKSGYRECGMLYVALSREDEKNLKARFRWQKKTGFPVQWKTREWILKNEPAVSAHALSGLFYPAIGRIQPVRLIEVMRAAAKKRGVKFLDLKEPAKVLLRGGKAAGVRAGKDFFQADAVINAAGSWAGTRVKPARGQILIVRKGRLKIDSILHTVNGGYVVPWDKDTLLLGSTVEFKGFKAVVTPEGRKVIRRKNEALVPGLKRCAEIDRWAGLRPFPEDRFPLIGKTRIPGLFMAAGYYRSGILIGHYAGRVLAKGVVSGKMPAVLKPFDPERFE